MYSEELDWCRRIKDAGWEIVYLPTATVIHHEGKSSEQVVPARHIHFQSSKVRYFRKHHGAFQAEVLRWFLLATYVYQLGAGRAQVAGGAQAPPACGAAAGLRPGAAFGSPNACRPSRHAAAMKILFVTGEFPPMQGGVGDYTRELGLALHDLGCEVQVVTSTPGWPGGWPDRSSPRRALELALLGRDCSIWSASSSRMWSTSSIRPRPMPCTRPSTSCRGAWAGWVPSVPRTVVTFHDLKVPYLFPKAGPLRRWVVDELARRSDAAITTNREDFEALQQRMGGIGRSPALIPIGSNIAPRLPAGYDRDAWRARWGAGPGDLLLCFFGFVNDRKGVDTLLQALDLLATDPQTRGQSVC